MAWKPKEEGEVLTSNEVSHVLLDLWTPALGDVRQPGVPQGRCGRALREDKDNADDTNDTQRPYHAVQEEHALLSPGNLADEQDNGDLGDGGARDVKCLADPVEQDGHGLLFFGEEFDVAAHAVMDFRGSDGHEGQAADLQVAQNHVVS